MYGCIPFNSMPPTMMSRIDNTVVCGKASGMPFTNVTRPDLENRCRDGFTACSKKTSRENTICYETRLGPEKTCGITDIQFVD
mmetsp:Transcript_17231/g.21757  ORF Transcript_17231/g.21757 Transcript_17231/m.21757 type:complete len:83 (+) Transcript_17231:416-664(+)